MTPTHLILTGNASWSGVTGIILHFFLQYSSNLLQFVQCSGNIMFLQVLSRKITGGDVMDLFLWKHKDLCVCLTAVGSYYYLQKHLCTSVLVLLFLQGSSDTVCHHLCGYLSV